MSERPIQRFERAEANERPYPRFWWHCGDPFTATLRLHLSEDAVVTVGGYHRRDGGGYIATGDTTLYATVLQAQASVVRMAITRRSDEITLLRAMLGDLKKECGE